MPAYHIVENPDWDPAHAPPTGYYFDHDRSEGATPAEAVRAWAEGCAAGGPTWSCTVWAVDVATREATRVRLTVKWAASYEAAALPPEPTP
jgi:hypothetical protein